MSPKMRKNPHDLEPGTIGLLDVIVPGDRKS